MKVFLSHCSADKKFVRTLKADLNENGIPTFLDEDTLEFGDSLKDKLEVNLDQTSHFVIILTENAINSEWVKFELKEALGLFSKRTLTKIIPIKYRNCSVPEELKSLLYADLSSEVVQIDGDRVRFLGEGYAKFLIRLIKTISASDKRLTEVDRIDLKKETTQTEKVLEKKLSDEFTTVHRIVKYYDLDRVKYFIDKIKNTKPFLSDASIYPVLLPPIYKQVFPNLEIGDSITFGTGPSSTIICHFAGFRRVEIGIAMQRSVRTFIKVEPGNEYEFAVNVKSTTFYRLRQVQ